jgi:hypothetical protein
MKSLAALIVILIFIISCKKNELGGDAIIEGRVVHHNKTITNCSVFLKFNAGELPGDDTALYDAKVRVDTNGYFKFTPYKGTYYVYASGIDPGIAPPYVVVGGQSVKLRAKETVSLTLFVTEGD